MLVYILLFIYASYAFIDLIFSYLIIAQKRQALLNEITRLKTYGAQGENIADGTGTLIITDIHLPLKREFIASQLEGKGGMYFVSIFISH